jgi:hypothetical protein
MNAQIILTATGGPLKGQEFIFTSRTSCIVGRSDDCLLGETKRCGVPRSSN